MRERKMEIDILLKDGSKVLLENVMQFYISGNYCHVCFYGETSKDIKILLNEIENLSCWNLSI